MRNFVSFNKLSLQIRFFLSMLLLIFIASTLIAVVVFYQFEKEAKEYHQKRLERKENALVEHINYTLKTTTYPITTKNIPLIFKDKVYELANIHNLEINFFDLQGKLLLSSKGGIFKLDRIKTIIPSDILEKIENSSNKRYVNFLTVNEKNYRSLYNYINNKKFKPLAILNVPYEEDVSFYRKELHSFLLRFGQIYLIMLVIAVVLSYFLSRYITQSLKIISDKIQTTNFSKTNKKIELEAGSKEINLLIASYNNMVDKLEESAKKLAQSEREQAWREMAKQVAHEIKNPLTPMRLTIQSFQMRFNENDPNIKQKIADYSTTLIQQIDTMSSVATAFSNFANMPKQKNEKLNMVTVVATALEIFNEPYIVFQPKTDKIITEIDKTQLTRIITNLVKNAVQAIPEKQENKTVTVCVKKDAKNAIITVSDNGKGIAKEYQQRIFEPKFTTKSSGMGLGLAIIKKIIENYNGNITFESSLNKTIFTVSIPIINT